MIGICLRLFFDVSCVQLKQLVQMNSMLENDQEALKKSYGLSRFCFFAFLEFHRLSLEMKLIQIQNEQTTNKDDLVLERDSLLQENQLFKMAIDQWSKQFEELRLINEELTRYLLLVLVCSFSICFSR